MEKKMRIMSEKPLNAETPVNRLRSWITANAVFFDRNQGQIPTSPVDMDQWRLSIDGEIQSPLRLSYDTLLRMPKAIAADTLECSGNGRSLLDTKSRGNPWTIGGVGNAVWGGVWLRDVLALARPTRQARHVAFEGFDTPLGSAKISFIRSIPMEKAQDSTLLAYEMNGDPLPLKHGHPLRALALGWTGANCVKWLQTITLLDKPFEGFFMDKVYRKFQKGQNPQDGEIVTGISLKSIITQPENGEVLEKGPIAVLGAAYAGESSVERVDVSIDGGASWQPAALIGPSEPFAWRHWQFLWTENDPGEVTLMARATDGEGRSQPMSAEWNVLGYGNNGVREHAVRVVVR